MKSRLLSLILLSIFCQNSAMEQEYQDHRNVASPILVNNAPSVEDVQFRHISIEIIQYFIIPQLDDKTLLNFALTNKKSLALTQKELTKREREHAKRILPDKLKKWTSYDGTRLFALNRYFPDHLISSRC